MSLVFVGWPVPHIQEQIFGKKIVNAPVSEQVIESS